MRIDRDKQARRDTGLRWNAVDCMTRRVKRRKQERRRLGTGKPDRRSGTVMLTLAAALFVVLLVIRMLVFVAGRHGR
jgi:hypothetical protein